MPILVLHATDADSHWPLHGRIWVAEEVLTSFEDGRVTIDDSVSNI